MQETIQIVRSSVKASFASFLAESPPAVYLGLSIPRYIFQALFFVLVARFVGGVELMRFALIGNAVQLAANMGLGELTETVMMEKWAGTLSLLIAAPGNRLLSLVSKGAAGMVAALIAIIVGFTATSLITGPVASIDRLLRAFPIVFLIIISVSGLGLTLGAVTLPTRIGVLVHNTMAYTLMIICGINFPIDVLPFTVQIIARFLPMTNGLLAIRQLIDGATYADVLGLIGLELLLGVGYYILGVLIFRRFLQTVRRRGNLELF